MSARRNRRPRFCSIHVVVEPGTQPLVLLFALDTSGQVWWRSLHGEAWVPMRMDRSTDRKEVYPDREP